MNNEEWQKYVESNCSAYQKLPYCAARVWSKSCTIVMCREKAKRARWCKRHHKIMRNGGDYLNPLPSPVEEEK